MYQIGAEEGKTPRVVPMLPYTAVGTRRAQNRISLKCTTGQMPEHVMTRI